MYVNYWMKLPSDFCCCSKVLCVRSAFCISSKCKQKWIFLDLLCRTYTLHHVMCFIRVFSKGVLPLEPRTRLQNPTLVSDIIYQSSVVINLDCCCFYTVVLSLSLMLLLFFTSLRCFPLLKHMFSVSSTHFN